MAKPNSKIFSPAAKPVLVLDAGTTGVKAFVFRGDEILSRAYEPLRKEARRRKGLRLVEQSPAEMVSAARRVLRQALRQSGLAAGRIAGLGITNQRETSVLWNRKSGRPVYPAIVWEDTRTAAEAESLRRRYSRLIRSKTGLPPDPYFSALKIGWILKHVPGAKAAAEKGKLAAGTVDSWLMWNLLEGKPHLTDYTNASRTLLFNIRHLEWDRELLRLFGIPAKLLAEAGATRSRFGFLKKEILGARIPVLAVCGDQQASLAAAGLARGTAKITYGTGAFVAESLGSRFALAPGFFTTLAPSGARPLFMLEAKVDDCGARIAPLIGRDAAMRKEVTRLARETNAYLRRLPVRPRRLTVDGGVTQYEPLVLIQRGISGIPVRRQKVYDGTALGAARLVYKSLDG